MVNSTVSPSDSLPREEKGRNQIPARETEGPCRETEEAYCVAENSGVEIAEVGALMAGGASPND